MSRRSIFRARGAIPLLGLLPALRRDPLRIFGPLIVSAAPDAGGRHPVEAQPLITPRPKRGLMMIVTERGGDASAESS